MTVGVLVNFDGEAHGMIMFLLNMDDAKAIMSILIQRARKVRIICSVS